MSWIRETSQGTELNLRVVPRASKNEVSGEIGDALKIRLQAPPVEGKANKALLSFLAESLDIPMRRISIISGETGRNKRVVITGMTAEQVAKKLS